MVRKISNGLGGVGRMNTQQCEHALHEFANAAEIGLAERPELARLRDCDKCSELGCDRLCRCEKTLVTAACRQRRVQKISLDRRERSLEADPGRLTERSLADPLVENRLCAGMRRFAEQRFEDALGSRIESENGNRAFGHAPRHAIDQFLQSGGCCMRVNSLRSLIALSQR